MVSSGVIALAVLFAVAFIDVASLDWVNQTRAIRYAKDRAGPNYQELSVEQIVEKFKKLKHTPEGDKKVITFVGFSGKGYRNKDAMTSKARERLESTKENSEHGVIVNIGATKDGIGAVYEIAQELGLPKAGIVSKLALQYGSDFGSDPDKTFVTEGDWGGWADKEKQILHPVSEAMVSVSDVIVAFGGGDVAKAEIEAAKSRGITVLEEQGEAAQPNSLLAAPAA